MHQSHLAKKDFEGNRSKTLALDLLQDFGSELGSLALKQIPGRSCALRRSPVS